MPNIDPNVPQPLDRLDANFVRNQFNALKEMIDALADRATGPLVYRALVCMEYDADERHPVPRRPRPARRLRRHRPDVQRGQFQHRDHHRERRVAGRRHRRRRDVHAAGL